MKVEELRTAMSSVQTFISRHCKREVGEVIHLSEFHKRLTESIPTCKLSRQLVAKLLPCQHPVANWGGKGKHVANIAWVQREEKVELVAVDGELRPRNANERG